MILYQWSGEHRNFGDDLNGVLWPVLLPGFFDQVEDTQFLGIGSILDDRHHPDLTKLVAGAGFGGYRPKRFSGQVMGSFIGSACKRTCRFWACRPNLASATRRRCCRSRDFPRCASRETLASFRISKAQLRGAWPDVAAIAGATLIDPRDDPLTVMAAIGKCRVIMSESLHGVIVADALRVPWIAIRRPSPLSSEMDRLVRNPRSRHRRPAAASVDRARAGASDLDDTVSCRPADPAPACRPAAKHRAQPLHRAGSQNVTRDLRDAEPQLSRDAVLDEASRRE